ncbi:MAG TPA: hypothetical protein VNR38_24105 [Ureibacillus sp.]|uniref:hypothetical protein n=1 Tax=Peribacillus asahii TaxID=228899 RepID=UPI0020792E4D|nr:hypothetical protein [Peribacillus asahii]USK61478.1 hypothetical protein LIT37_09235 [Peribacillus asahii]HWL26796.1 hypothetical protein [Ureibacillus sp.]
MSEKHQHALYIVDFVTTGFNATFVKIKGYDAILEREFEGEVKFLDDRPFGDIVHPERSLLSPECRQYVQERLLNKYHAGEFN